jgi:hypothetical protein
MSADVYIMVDTDQTFEAFVQSLEQLVQLSFTSQRVPGIEVQYEASDEQKWLAVAEQTYGNDRDRNGKNLDFEEYRYWIRIHARYRENLETTERWRKELAYQIYDQLKATNRYRLLMVDDLQRFLDEYTPETFTRQQGDLSLKTRDLPLDLRLYVGTDRSLEQLVQDSKAYFLTQGLSVDGKTKQTAFSFPWIEIFIQSISSVMKDRDDVKGYEGIEPAGYSYSVRAQARVRLPGGLRIPGERRFRVYQFMSGLFEYLRQTGTYRLLLRDEDEGKMLIEFDPKTERS